MGWSGGGGSTSLTFSGMLASTASVLTYTVDSLTSYILASANPLRIGITIHNGSGVLFVKYGTNASSTNFTHRLTSNTVLEISNYTGQISARTASGSSEVSVTEME